MKVVNLHWLDVCVKRYVLSVEESGLKLIRDGFFLRDGVRVDLVLERQS